jgi:hypothetical protein
MSSQGTGVSGATSESVPISTISSLITVAKVAVTEVFMNVASSGVLVRTTPHASWQAGRESVME